MLQCLFTTIRVSPGFKAGLYWFCALKKINAFSCYWSFKIKKYRRRKSLLVVRNYMCAGKSQHVSLWMKTCRQIERILILLQLCGGMKNYSSCRYRLALCFSSGGGSKSPVGEGGWLGWDLVTAKATAYDSHHFHPHPCAPLDMSSWKR